MYRYIRKKIENKINRKDNGQNGGQRINVEMQKLKACRFLLYPTYYCCVTVTTRRISFGVGAHRFIVNRVSTVDVLEKRLVLRR